MFNTLASYLLGTSNQENTGRVEERNDVRLLTRVLSDDDWVLVDRDSEGNSEESSSESLDGYDDLESYNKQLPHLLSRTSSTGSLPCTTMDESWFVTPPPCFTSAGPVHMETSPLENLLIEHPSMSVYQHTHPALITQRHNSSIPVQSASTSEFSADEDELEEFSEHLPIQRVEVEIEVYTDRQLHIPRRNRVDILIQQEKQWFKTKQAQKVQLQMTTKSLKRKYLHRANKAREVNYCNRHQRRNKRSQGATRSYANNNRKC